MRGYRAILAKRFKEKGLTQSEVSKRIGYSSGSTVGMMLRGDRTIGREDLERMCEVAGITLIELASLSDDLKLTTTHEATEAASILDALPPEKRELAMQMLRAIKG